MGLFCYITNYVINYIIKYVIYSQEFLARCTALNFSLYFANISVLWG